MLKLFEYNWQVRKDWFDWCDTVSEEDLLVRRIGGPGSILYTLFHIIDVEYSWIIEMQGKPVPQTPPFEDYANVQKLREFSARCHEEIAPFIYGWNSSMEADVMTEHHPNGEVDTFKFGEVMRHVIAHEIHHIGQLSVWSREIGKKPVTANLIHRGLFDH